MYVSMDGCLFVNLGRKGFSLTGIMEEGLITVKLLMMCLCRGAKAWFWMCIWEDRRWSVRVYIVVCLKGLTLLTCLRGLWVVD